MTPDEKAELRREAEAATTPGLRDRRVAIAEYRLAACNAIPKLLDELEHEASERDAWQLRADREELRANSLAAQVVALRETISDWLADYSPSSEAMYRAKAVLADTAAVAAEWKRRERLAGAQRACNLASSFLADRLTTSKGPSLWSALAAIEAVREAMGLAAMEAEASQEGQA